MTEAQTIPQAIADRYLATLTTLVTKGSEAVAASSSPQAIVWKQKVLPLLQLRLTAAKSAAAHYAIGDEQPLVVQAKQSLSLARDIDGYSMNFAGEEFATQLTEAQRLVVFAAWQVCQSAGAV
jgi:hypothetical protein